MKTSQSLKRIIIYELKLVTVVKVLDFKFVVFILEHDMVIIARAFELSLEMPELILSVSQSKLKNVSQIRLSQDRYLILASETTIEVRGYFE